MKDGEKAEAKKKARWARTKAAFILFFLNSEKGGKGKTRRSIPEPSQRTRCLAHGLRRDESGSVEREAGTLISHPLSPAPKTRRVGKWNRIQRLCKITCFHPPACFYEPLVVTQRIDKPLLHGVRSCRGARVRSRCLSPSAKLSPLVVTLPVLCAKNQVTQPVEGDVVGKGKSFVRFGLQYHLRVSFIFQVSDKF